MCDTHWDCPGGRDEAQCNKSVDQTSCPGQFSCIDSVICIAISDICNKVEDCPKMDDEMFCISEIISCIPGCFCLLYSISCREKDSLSSLGSTILPYIVVLIQYSNPGNVTELLLLLNQPVILLLRENHIINLCQLMTNLQTVGNNSILKDIDVSLNLMKSISSYCFEDFNGLIYINISNNKINSLRNHAMHGLNNAVCVDLADNEIEMLLEHSLSGLRRLQVLNLSGNFLLEVDLNVFSGSLDIKSIVTSSYKVCCLKPSDTTICPVTAIWPNSCYRLLEEKAVKIIIWIVSVVGILLIVPAGKYNSAANVKDRGKGYRRIVGSILFGDLLMCMSLLITSIADSIFDDKYLKYESLWRKNPVCYLVASLSISSNLISVYSLNFMALSRFCVMRDNIKTRFSQTRFITYLVCIGIFLGTSLAIGLMLSYRFTFRTSHLETGLCILVGYREKSVIPLLVSILTITVQAISTITISGIYILLYRFLATQRENMQKFKSGGKTDGFLKSVFACLTTLLCWIPCVVLLTMTLIWENYPHKLLIWTFVTVLPINSLLDPVIFVHVNLFSAMIRKALKNDSSIVLHLF